MRLLAKGKWLTDQKRWSVIIPLASQTTAEKNAADAKRKAPIKKGRAQMVPFPARSQRS
ncbi:MAG: hypothetical protein N3C12_00990 [Candidatus Binatia bacterium]|nr:hypothetical protein [Candidatus Binatia bacterium]